MKKICVMGSVNLDMVFQVDRFVKAKETKSSKDMEVFLGGKGLNQSLALRKAYEHVYFAGNIGKGDDGIIAQISAHGVDASLVSLMDTQTGTAFIQVDEDGQNCIVLHKGANHQFTKERIDFILDHFKENDLIVLQNETNLLEYMIRESKERGLLVALNPSPYEETISLLPLELVDYILLNEVEGEALTGKVNPNDIMETMETRYPEVCIVLTLGADGVLCSRNRKRFFQKSRKVQVVDSTAAGDTFTGYFLASELEDKDILESLQMATFAAGISVTRKGASTSIPSLDEVLKQMKDSDCF